MKDIQDEIAEWVNKNFPNTTATEQFLGVVEEVGELSHAILKGKQGIRQEGLSSIMENDAVADISIFLLSYCSFKGIDFEKNLRQVWKGVKKRDWKRFPVDGFSK